jgi:hypothetical protein
MAKSLKSKKNNDTMAKRKSNKKYQHWSTKNCTEN